MNEKKIKSLIEELVDEKTEEVKSEDVKSEERQETVDNKAEVKASEVKSTLDVDSLVEAIAEGVKGKLGGTKEESENYVKENILNSEEGLKAVKYPQLKGDLETLTDEEQILSYFKALFDFSLEGNAAVKVLSEGVAADGGNLVPTPLRSEIFRLLPDMSVMRRLAQTIPMTSQTLKLPTNTTDPVAYWIPENKTKTTTSAEFGQVTLTANKLVTRIPISDELVADATVDIIRWMTERFAESLATGEDKAFFTGSGTGQPRGINQETLATRVTGATFDFDDVIGLMHSVRQSVRIGSNRAFVGHQNVIRQLKEVKDGNNNYIWRVDGQNNGQISELAETIYGVPVFEQNDLSQDELYFGDWSKYIIGDRQQITVATSREAADAWVRDQTEIKAVERLDGRAVLTGAFGKITGIA